MWFSERPRVLLSSSFLISTALLLLTVVQFNSSGFKLTRWFKKQKKITHVAEAFHHGDNNNWNADNGKELKRLRLKLGFLSRALTFFFSLFLLRSVSICFSSSLSFFPLICKASRKSVFWISCVSTAVRPTHCFLTKYYSSLFFSHHQLPHFLLLLLCIARAPYLYSSRLEFTSCFLSFPCTDLHSFLRYLSQDIDFFNPERLFDEGRKW